MNKKQLAILILSILVTISVLALCIVSTAMATAEEQAVDEYHINLVVDDVGYVDGALSDELEVQSSTIRVSLETLFDPTISSLSLSYVLLDQDMNEISEKDLIIEEPGNVLVELEAPVDSIPKYVKLASYNVESDVSDNSITLFDNMLSVAIDNLYLSTPISELHSAWVDRIVSEKEAKIAERNRIQQHIESYRSRAKNIPMRRFTDLPYDDVLLIGDSIMEMTGSRVRDIMPGAQVDAVSSRFLERGGTAEGYSNNDGVLDHVRGADRSFNRFIIGTGNNDSAGMSIADGEEIVSELYGKQIWFVTEYVTNSSRSTQTTNSTIAYLCDKYPNVHKVAWYEIVSGNHSYLADNCHPNGTGTSVYAKLLKESVDSPR